MLNTVVAPKYSDPGSPVEDVEIGDLLFKNSLTNLGQQLM